MCRTPCLAHVAETERDEAAHLENTLFERLETAYLILYRHGLSTLASSSVATSSTSSLTNFFLPV